MKQDRSKTDWQTKNSHDNKNKESHLVNDLATGREKGLESTWVSLFCGSTVGQKCKQCLNSLRKWQRMLEQTMQVKTDLQHLTEMVNLLGKGVSLTKTDFSCWLCCGTHLATRPVQ
jgi:hypothetical protein